MTQAFPLYDELVATEGVPTPDWRQVGSLPLERTQIMYALILHHSLQDSTQKKGGLPYGLKLVEGGKGLICNLALLPTSLQQILGRYLVSYN